MPGKRLSFDMIQLIFYNHQLGKSVAEISKIFSIKKGTIYNVTKRANNEGRLELKNSGGRKPVLSHAAKRFMMRKLRANPCISTRDLVKELQQQIGVVVSRETVRKFIIKTKNPQLSTTNF